MKLLSQVCLWPRTNSLNYGDDPDYDQDSNYDFDGGLPSLSDCLVLDLTLRLSADRPVAHCARPKPLFNLRLSLLDLHVIVFHLKFWHNLGLL